MATHKSSAVTQLTDMAECCICLKTFTDPRMLPCIHTFCFQCLEDMVDKSDKKPGDEVQCPMCRKEFTIPNDGVQGIQKNFFVAGMIEVRSTLNPSKMADIPCDVCKTKKSKATSRCLDCQENLCEDCSKMHKAFKVSRNHKVQKVDDEVGEEEAIKYFNVMNCDIHRGKVLDYYCCECKKVVCVSCFVESHKTHDCKDVNTVEDEFRQMIKSSADQMSTLAAELLAKKEKMESKEDFLAKVAVREKAILERSDELKEMIDQHAKLLLSTFDEIKNRRLKEIQAREDEMARQLMIVESFKRYCNELRSKGSASDICRSKDEVLLRAEVIEEDHETYVMRPRVSCDVAFLATDLSNFLKSTVGNLVGSLEEKDECLGAFAVMIIKDGLKVSSQKMHLNCRSDNVSLLEDVPTRVSLFPAAAVYNNAMFLAGIGENLNEIWKFNFSSGWRRCGSLVQGRQNHCEEFIDETLYICGGNNKAYNSAMNDIEAYNAVTEKSLAVGQLKIGSDWSDCVAYKGSIYVFGGIGIDKDRKLLDCVQAFNPIERTCTLLSTPIPRPISYVRALSWNDYAILLGRDTCFVLGFENKTWQERKQFKAVSEATRFGAVLENERIFIIREFRKVPDGASRPLLYKGIEYMYIKASSIVSNEAPKWRPWGQLTDPFQLYAVPKISLLK